MARHLMIFFLLASDIVLWGQRQRPVWIKNPQNGYTDGKAIVAHPNGGVYAIGQMIGTNSFDGQILTTSPTAFSDAFLAKYNSDGAVQWVKQLMTSSDYAINTLVDLKLDSKGDLIILGGSFTSESFLNATPNVGAFVAKLDADGNLKWIHYEPNVYIQNYNDNLRGNKLAIDHDDNIIWYSDQNNEPSFGEYAGGLALIKYAPDGTKLLNKLITENVDFRHPVLESVSVDGAGNVSVSGTFFEHIKFGTMDFYDNSGNRTNRSQFFLAKFDSKFDLQWVIHSNFGSSAVSSPHASDIEGNIYLTAVLSKGTVLSQGPTNYYYSNADGSAVIKINSSGQISWVNTGINAAFYNVAIGENDFIYLTGFYYNEIDYQFYRQYTLTPESIILKINSTGKWVAGFASRSLNGSTSDAYGYQTTIDASGTMYTVGSFHQTINYGCMSASTSGDLTMFIIKHEMKAEPLLTVTGPPVICEGDKVMLMTDSVPGAVHYEWYLPDGASPVDGETVTTSNKIELVVNTLANYYPVYVSLGDTCAQYANGGDYVFQIFSKPPPPLPVKSRTLCPESEFIQHVYTYDSISPISWVPPANVFIQANADSAKISLLKNFVSGYVIVSSSNLCGTVTDTLRLSLYSAADKPILSGSSSLCQRDSYFQKNIIPAANAISYDWEIPSGTAFNSLYPHDGIALNLIIGPLFTSGQIRVRSVGQCGASDPSDPFFLSRVALPDAASNIVGPDQLCTEQVDVKFTIPSISNASAYVWTLPTFLNPNGVVTTLNEISLKASREGNGLIKVYGINSCGEKGDSSLLHLTAYSPLQKPLIQRGTCDKELITTAVAPDWYYNEMPMDFHASNLSVIDSGVYYVKIDNFCGTQQSEKVAVYPLPGDPFFPNVITPNGDGKNDYFILDKSLTNSSISVFNRWGEKVFSSFPYHNEWDGIGLDTGTYFYFINNSCSSQPYKGWINLIR